MNSNFSLSFFNRHGDEIAIPLLVAEEKDALIKSLTAKATEIAGLKASLVSDLSNLVGNLNGWKNEKERKKHWRKNKNKIWAVNNESRIFFLFYKLDSTRLYTESFYCNFTTNYTIIDSYLIQFINRMLRYYQYMILIYRRD